MPAAGSRRHPGCVQVFGALTGLLQPCLTAVWLRLNAVQLLGKAGSELAVRRLPAVSLEVSPTLAMQVFQELGQGVHDIHHRPYLSRQRVLRTLLLLAAVLEVSTLQNAMYWPSSDHLAVLCHATTRTKPLCRSERPMCCGLRVQVLQISGSQAGTQLQWHLGGMLADASSELSAIAQAAVCKFTSASEAPAAAGSEEAASSGAALQCCCQAGLHLLHLCCSRQQPAHTTSSSASAERLLAAAKELRRPLFSLVGGWHRSSGARLATQPATPGQPQQLGTALSQLEALGHTAATLAAAGRLAPQVYAEAPELVMQALTGLAGVQAVSPQQQVKLAPWLACGFFTVMVRWQSRKRQGGAPALRLRSEAAHEVPAKSELPSQASP